ncbi:hypothetical protein QLL95_gp0868 [Cotonvirus japonicus]|uniref:NAD(+)--protein-arginine ADP-ribosyltransferase n=1 Tax=Cotonvirus japonicus TaxID=2811091 RepID=A0ABM7NSV7_9VIRU|nr:hypothetical protein QLL95_gp0868 [Cotonvirus japonicus]BCS83255.1 hypothetical protein [Cotonvirus japonicus]
MEIEKENDLHKDLQCPITNELMEDPIRVPCCGQAFERLAIVQWLETSRTCPWCKENLITFDALTARKDILLVRIIDTLKSQKKIIQQHSKHHTWNCKVTPIFDLQNKILPISQLSVTLDNSVFDTKMSLFIIVIDKSGSMGGNPFNQVKSALTHIISLTASSPFIKTVIVPYDSTAKIIDINGSEADTIRIIHSLSASGGTNFNAAFNRVGEILSQYNSNVSNYGHANIAFLTDGDSSEPIEPLMQNFKHILNENWCGSLTVHSIGFGQHCNKILLEALWQSGTINGTFRYAEPQDDPDTLCNKLTGLFDLVKNFSNVPINFKLSNLSFVLNKNNKSTNIDVQFPINQRKQGIYDCWINGNINDTGSLIINSQLDNNIEIPIQINESTNVVQRKILYHKWISVSADEIASDILELNKIDKSIYDSDLYELQTAILVSKIESMMFCVDKNIDLVLYQKIEYLNTSLSNMINGQKINEGKLGDMRFASQYTVTSGQKQKQIIDTQSRQQPIFQISNEQAFEEYTKRYTRNNKNKNRNDLQESIMNNVMDTTSSITTYWLNLATPEIMKQRDIDGNTALMLAAFCGQSSTIDVIIKKFPDIDLELVNNDGETAITLAIKSRGFDRSINILLDAGAVIPHNRVKSLERYAIDMNYNRTAKIIGERGDDSTDIHENMSETYILFMYEKIIKRNLRFDINNYLKIALAKSMTELVEKLIEVHGAKPSIDMLLKLITSESNCYEIIKYLISYSYEEGLIDVNQVNDNGDFILFRASEKGNLQLVKMFIELGANVNQQNKLGNTAIWIACWKKYPCIISELIDSGADINLANFKGNVPLTNTCQMGPKKIAEMLVARGADVNVINKNGDTLLLLCCRNGQHEVLEVLLSRICPSLIEHKAHIDGFSAILAATESNKPDCIKILCDYGINIEQKTDINNEIIKGATSLHLAAYYNRIEAAVMLISLGANINSLDINNQTPLHTAIIQGNYEIVKLLRNYKANLFIIDSFGGIPMSYCRDSKIKDYLANPLLKPLMKLASGNFSTISEKNACKLLRENESIGILNNSDIIDVVNFDGKTPLMMAIINSKYELVKLFLELGANPAHENNQGNNCYFWVFWINNPKITSLFDKPDIKVVEKINQLKKISIKNSQNAMILYLNNKPKTTTISQKMTSSIYSRMDDFINDIGKSSYFIKSICNNPLLESVSIIDLFDQKEFLKLCSLDSCADIIFEAKVLTINLIASGNTNLEPHQAITITMYSTILSSLINSLILKENISFMKVYIQHLMESLNRLPSFEAEVFIGTDKLCNRERFIVGEKISWPIFISGSTSWKIATENTINFTTKKQGTIFLIRSRTGKYIGQYSFTPFDSEVVFLPNTNFTVTAWYTGDVIALGQSNIRTHSFEVKEDNIHKMIHSNNSLIIELTEI